MGAIHDLILSVKNKEGFKFDGEVAKLIGIDPRELATHKSRNNLPRKLRIWYCSHYDIELKNLEMEIRLTRTDIQLKGEHEMDAHYVIELQKDKIEHLQYKLNKLSKLLDEQKATKKDDWLDIEYDVKTRNIYNKSFLKMTEYEMIKYSDFFKKLGYNDNEIEKEYELHKKNLLDVHRDVDDYGIVVKKWIHSNKKISTWATIDKNGKEIPLTLWLDISKSLGKTIVTYDSSITYIKKDGSHLNAHIYCCWDLVRMTGEAKIKFLSE